MIEAAFDPTRVGPVAWVLGEVGERCVHGVRGVSEPVVIDRRPKLAEQLPERLRVLAGERVERALARLVRKERALGRNGVDLLRLLRELLWNTATRQEASGGDRERETHALFVTARGKP